MNSFEEKIRRMLEEEEKLSKIFDLIGFPREHTMQCCSHDLRVATTAYGPTRNKILQNCRYHETETRFLHFTSLKVLYSIINEQSIRLYNLHNSSDKEEYKYMGDTLKHFFKRIGESDTEISNRMKSAKDNHFIFSLTPLSNLENQKHWKEYGNKGKGVALEFELLNSPCSWDGFHYSKVFYGKPPGWDQALDLLLELQEISPNNFRFMFDMLLSLHKSPETRFQEEEELRILAHRPGMWGFAFDSLIKNDVGKDGLSPLQYLQLPLYVANGREHSFTNLINQFNSSLQCSIPITEQDFLEYLNNSPKIKLSKVHFSNGFPWKSGRFNKFAGSLTDLIFDKLGYTIIVN